MQYSKYITAIGGLLSLGLFKDGVKHVYDTLIDTITGTLFEELRINIEDNPKCRYAILRDIENYVGDRYNIVVNDGVQLPHYRLEHGYYILKPKVLDEEYWILIAYKHSEIILRIIPTFTNIFTPSNTQLSRLKHYMNSLYQTYCAPTEIVTYFTSGVNKWEHPTIRSSRNLNNLQLTEDMTCMLNDVDMFKSQKYIYDKQGIPYRRGYLIYGETGTGKTTMIELIDQKYDMTIYCLNLNCANMTDSNLIHLINTVPPNSILVLEEIDKQILTLLNHKYSHISIGGLLSGLDGPQRLSNSSIVIMTSNTRYFLDAESDKALVRKGRIDCVYEFKTPV